VQQTFSYNTGGYQGGFTVFRTYVACCKIAGCHKISTYYSASGFTPDMGTGMNNTVIGLFADHA
jgi:hypothetical protein